MVGDAGTGADLGAEVGDVALVDEIVGVGVDVGAVRDAGAFVESDAAAVVKQDMAVEDDHLPFVARNVPSVDVIDLDYGPNNSYHHTAQDTLDKISAHSLTIDGDVLLETIRLINQR